MAQNSARGVALAALREWRRGKRFADSIIQDLFREESLGGSDQGFATELFYGVLRNLTLLDFYINRLRSGSLDHDSRDLLRVGLFQLFFLRTPGHAAIYETVELASRKNRGLINAVLRTALRSLTELESAGEGQPDATRFSHPQFLLDRWTNQYGAKSAAALCEWNNQPAPVYARTNRLKISREAFVEKYPTAEPLAAPDNFLRLDGIPGKALAAGECYIQDPSTVAACELLDPQPGETILDACAAPGGKTVFLAELMQNRGRLIACDRDPARVQILRENLDRLGVTMAFTHRHDWQSDRALENGPPALFDRILLDAPCTNTGVMRRRVDVRWRLRAQDFAQMPRVQGEILRTLVPLLKPGGTLVYSTCSLEREENEDVVAQALEEFPALQLTEQKSALPFRDHFDGAFAVRLLRRG